MEYQCKKPRSKRAQQEEIGGQLLADNLIGQIDRLDAIGKQTERTAELLKGLIDQAAQTRIAVDTGPLQEQSDKLINGLKRQVQHVMQPPIVLKMIILLFVVSLVATWAAGYYVRDCRVWKTDYLQLEQQYDQVRQEMQKQQTTKPVKKK